MLIPVHAKRGSEAQICLQTLGSEWFFGHEQGDKRNIVLHFAIRALKECVCKGIYSVTRENGDYKNLRRKEANKLCYKEVRKSYACSWRLS